jgi:hypothetical protein
MLRPDIDLLSPLLQITTPAPTPFLTSADPVLLASPSRHPPPYPSLCRYSCSLHPPPCSSQPLPLLIQSLSPSLLLYRVTKAAQSRAAPSQARCSPCHTQPVPFCFDWKKKKQEENGKNEKKRN